MCRELFFDALRASMAMFAAGERERERERERGRGRGRGRERGGGGGRECVCEREFSGFDGIVASYMPIGIWIKNTKP